MYKHRIFAIDESVQEAYHDEFVTPFGPRYELAKGWSDSNMLVVNGDWKKQFEYSPSSVLARVCGTSMILLSSLVQAAEADIPLNVAHFLPLNEHVRCTTLKVHVSEACKIKHKVFDDQLSMLSGLLDNNAVPISHRYKFELIHGDVSCIVGILEACKCARTANGYRWLVVKEEEAAVTEAAAAAIPGKRTSKRNTMVMTVSHFVATLGARNIHIYQSQRHN